MRNLYVTNETQIYELVMSKQIAKQSKQNYLECLKFSVSGQLQVDITVCVICFFKYSIHTDINGHNSFHLSIIYILQSTSNFKISATKL